VAFASALSFAGPLDATQSGIYLVHGTTAGYRFLARPEFPAGEYLGLYCSEECKLEKTELLIKKAPVQDSEGAVSTGFIARTNSGKAALFLVRGRPSLQEGPVPTWYVNRRFLAVGAAPYGNALKTATRTISVAGTPLRISASVEEVAAEYCRPSDCPQFPKVTWRMQYAGVERTLSVLTGNELGTPIPIDDFIVWIGDLDGDAKPDLLVRPQNREDYLEMSLFLSRMLKPDQPWKASARFYFWDPKNPGC
jgi:hypothetical protein